MTVMPDEQQLEQTVLEALTRVAPETDLGALVPGVNFRDQLELDSVDYLNLMLDLERRLHIRVPETDYPRLSCLDGAVAYLRERVGNG